MNIGKINCPRVKICGIRSAEEILYLNEAKVDFAGFMFYEKSSRFISEGQYQKLVKKMNPDIKRVGVVVSPDEIMINRMNELDLDVLQIHGWTSIELIKKSRHPVWQAINLKNEEMDTDPNMYQKEVMERNKLVQGLLVDGMRSGGGKTFDWSSREVITKLKEMTMPQIFVLAGGLNKDNVKQGISLFSPDVVDVSSGVEKEDRTGKDRNKILEFIRKVREYES